MMNYNDTIKDLTSQGKFYINLGLERISAIMELLGNPQDNINCIQVAGTNGKGSVCTILSSVLYQFGYKTGLYTSPHIFDYTERIKINNIDISKQEFSKYYNTIIKLADKNSIHLTEFEILTSIMYKYFYDNNVDIAVIETGLGGRYDATNILKTNICSVITHIDLDHTDRLGDTKNKIAFEKSGIIKPNSYTFTFEKYDEINTAAKLLNTKLVIPNYNIDNKYINALSLKGVHQKENLALAMGVISEMFPKISEENIINGLKTVKNPCRFQYIKERNLIVDAAHNPNGFKALSESLDIYFPNIKRNYIFGCLNTKDYKKMIEYIKKDKNLNMVYVYHFNNPNSCDYETIKSALNISCYELKNIDEYKFDKNILTVICGSFYMLNEILPDR